MRIITEWSPTASNTTKRMEALCIELCWLVSVLSLIAKDGTRLCLKLCKERNPDTLDQEETTQESRWNSAVCFPALVLALGALRLTLIILEMDLPRLPE